MVSWFQQTTMSRAMPFRLTWPKRVDLSTPKNLAVAILVTLGAIQLVAFLLAAVVLPGIGFAIWQGCVGVFHALQGALPWVQAWGVNNFTLVVGVLGLAGMAHVVFSRTRRGRYYPGVFGALMVVAALWLGVLYARFYPELVARQDFMARLMLYSVLMLLLLYVYLWIERVFGTGELVFTVNVVGSIVSVMVTLSVSSGVAGAGNTVMHALAVVSAFVTSTFLLAAKENLSAFGRVEAAQGLSDRTGATR